jgi:hypothetical protein
MSAREISGSRSPFQARLEISKSLEKMMVNVSLDMVLRVVEELSELYKFDSCEAIELLGLNSVEVVEPVLKSKKVSKKPERVEKVKPMKAAFQLPFTRGCEDCCEGLRKSQGLYTQCQLKKRENSSYCNGCEAQASKNASGKPDCGTVEDRLSCGLNDYRSPSGKQVVAYAKVMKKLGLSKEQVLEEASRLGLEIDEAHFEMQSESKKGRPKAEKSVSVSASVSEDKKKGRPKKSKKVLEIETNDIFAELVASSATLSLSDPESEDETVKCLEADFGAENESEKEAENEAEKEAEKEKKEAENEKKEAAKQKKEAEKQKKGAAKEAEKQKKEAEKAAKEAEKQKKEAEKAAKEAEKQKKEAEKAAKEAQKKQKVTEKPSKEAEKKPAKEEDPIKVVIINAKGQTKKTGLQESDKKFLKSSAGEILSFKTQETIGMWNAEESRIEFNDDYVESDAEDEDSEEEAEEYDD